MNWKHSKTIIAIVLALAAGYLIGYAVYGARQNTVASVNGEEITKQQLYDEMLRASGEDTLNSLISQKLVAMEIKKQNITVSDEEVQTELQKYYDAYGGEDGFGQTLSENGYTLDEFKKEIVTELSIRKILEPQITITDEELKSYFEENKTLFTPEGQTADFEKSKNDVRDALMQSKLENEYSTWQDNLYQQYSVKNYLYG
ncbi:MAG: SurA N-terminal domain-containing protein [Syntrophomonadaceae bacterium]|nr:SurA N-terminal domain-containing protein [Syntrophomonadaceae bacterium]